jgi:hypothetical protein
MLFVHLPELKSGADTDAEEAKVESVLAAGKTSVLQFPHVILGAIAIFFYVGAEVISYDTFAGFGQHLGYPLETAKSFAFLYGLRAACRICRGDRHNAKADFSTKGTRLVLPTQFGAERLRIIHLRHYRRRRFCGARLFKRRDVAGNFSRSH